MGRDDRDDDRHQADEPRVRRGGGPPSPIGRCLLGLGLTVGASIGIVIARGRSSAASRRKPPRSPRRSGMESAAMGTLALLRWPAVFGILVLAAAARSTDVGPNLTPRGEPRAPAPACFRPRVAHSPRSPSHQYARLADYGAKRCKRRRRHRHDLAVPTARCLLVGAEVVAIDRPQDSTRVELADAPGRDRRRLAPGLRRELFEPTRSRALPPAAS